MSQISTNAYVENFLFYFQKKVYIALYQSSEISCIQIVHSINFQRYSSHNNPPNDANKQTFGIEKELSKTFYRIIRLQTQWLFHFIELFFIVNHEIILSWTKWLRHKNQWKGGFGWTIFCQNVHTKKVVGAHHKSTFLLQN